MALVTGALAKPVVLILLLPMPTDGAINRPDWAIAVMVVVQRSSVRRFFIECGLLIAIYHIFWIGTALEGPRSGLRTKIYPVMVRPFGHRSAAL